MTCYCFFDLLCFFCLFVSKIQLSLLRVFVSPSFLKSNFLFFVLFRVEDYEAEGGGEKRRKTMTNHGFLTRRRGRPSLSSRLARRVTQLKQKVVAQRGAPSGGMHRRRRDPRPGSHANCRESDTGTTQTHVNLVPHTLPDTNTPISPCSPSSRYIQ